MSQQPKDVQTTEVFEVDGWNNFCRVFELPQTYPRDYCFGGGHPVNFQLVDWFHPIPGLPIPSISKEAWMEKHGEIEAIKITTMELRDSLVPFLKDKVYVKLGRNYLVLCKFGAAFVFSFFG